MRARSWLVRTRRYVRATSVASGDAVPTTPPPIGITHRPPSGGATVAGRLQINHLASLAARGGEDLLRDR